MGVREQEGIVTEEREGTLVLRGERGETGGEERRGLEDNGDG